MAELPFTVALNEPDSDDYFAPEPGNDDICIDAAFDCFRQEFPNGIERAVVTDGDGDVWTFQAISEPDEPRYVLTAKGTLVQRLVSEHGFSIDVAHEMADLAIEVVSKYDPLTATHITGMGDLL